MRKIFNIMLAAAVILPALPCRAAGGSYLIKLRDGIVYSQEEQTAAEPLVPEWGLYVTDNISETDMSDIEFCEYDAPVELYDTYSYDLSGSEWEYKITGMKSLWSSGFCGSGVRIGIIDSGCNAHAALAGNLCEGANFADDDGDAADTTDNIGHGTAVSGVAAAAYGDINVIGTAHRAKIIPLKFIDRDANGNAVGGTTSRIVKAIKAAVDDYDCDVINMSCGTINTQALRMAVEYAHDAGVTITAAVGNSGNAAVNYPAGYETVIGVASVDSNKLHAASSNSNSSVNVSAPGVNVALLSGTDGYKTSNGTSYAAPYAAGIAADMIAEDPELSPDEVKSIIEDTAEDLGEVGRDNDYGYGLINANAIADRLMGDCDVYFSKPDICTADGKYEVRITKRSASAILPEALLAGYTEAGALSEISAEKNNAEGNIFVVRLKENESSYVKFFAWDSLEKMTPFKPDLDSNAGN